MNYKNVRIRTFIFLLLVTTGFISAQSELTILTPTDDARPVSTALSQLRASQGLPITYEDPRYLFSGDLQDVTERVQQVSDIEPTAGRVIVPKGKPFTFVYSANNFGNPKASLRTIQRMLSEYATVGGQVFSVASDGNRLNVIPQQAADEKGKMTPQTPLLDTLISLPAKQRDGITLLAEICHAVTVSSGVKVDVGTVPSNLLHQYRTNTGVKNQIARQALAELLDGVRSDHLLVWDLYNDPDGFALNID